jgi:hypothetical protein
MVCKLSSFPTVERLVVVNDDYDDNFFPSTPCPTPRRFWVVNEIIFGA